MFVYLYDGTFEGLLTCFSVITEKKESAESVCDANRYKPDFFSVPVEVVTDEKVSREYFDFISHRLGSQSIKEIYYCFLSKQDGIEKILLDYINLGMKSGNNFSGNLKNNAVLTVRKIYRKVAFEVHRFQGLIRFRKLADGVLYAPFAPDFNIAALLAPHFARRLSAEKWMIHDTGRGIGVYYNSRHWQELIITDAPRTDDTRNNVLAEDEADYQALWKTFYDSIGIKNRANHKLRMQFMPKKYWKYLIEMEDK